MMKKWIALLVSLMMLFTMSHALAAPTRDMLNMDIDIGEGLQKSINGTVGEMLGQEVNVYIYSSSFDGETAVVFGDVYTKAEPEELGAYLHNCRLTLQYETELAEGFSVLSCDELSLEYRCGDVMQWEEVDNAEYGYSFNLPTGFTLSEDVAECMVWQIAEGETITVTSYENPGYQKVMENYLNAPSGEVLMESELFGYFYTNGDTFFELHLAVDGTEYAYTVRLDFPAERQAEYLLYGEMIRNSFLVWGGAVG